MDVASPIVIGLAIVAGGFVPVGVAMWLLQTYRRRHLQAIADRVGFRVVDSLDTLDPALESRAASGSFRGSEARVAILKASSADIDVSEGAQGTNDANNRVVALGMKLPFQKGYLMAIRRCESGEGIAMERQGLVSPVGDDDIIARIETEFVVLESPEQPAGWLRDASRVNCLIELKRTYDIVRFYDGWLWIGIEHPNLDTLDVDFDHLWEASRKIAA